MTALPLRWQFLADQFAVSLEQCRQRHPAPAREAEECFRVALAYWHHLKDLYGQNVLTVSEQIIFFKRVKPNFTWHIEYYLLLNQAILFLPADSQKQTAYLQEELQRCQRFYRKHADFIAYYEQGLDDFDSCYFIATATNDLSSFEKVYDDPDCRSSHDHLIRGVIAHRQYEMYIQLQFSF